MKAIIWRWIYSIISFIIPGIVLVISVIQPGINGYERAMFPDMIYGTAHKPYVYRVLMPSMVRLLQAPIPMHVRNKLNSNIYNLSFLRTSIDQLGWERDHLIDYAIALILLYVFLYAFLGANKYLIDALIYSPNVFSEAASLIIVIILPLLFKYYTYIYDFPNLFLFTLALGLMARQQWNLFMLVFIFATFNKETSILLTLIFLIHFYFKHSKQLEFRKHLILQVFLYIAIKLFITFLFINNPGTFLEFHFYDYNLIFLRKMKLLPIILIWLPIIFLVFYKWRMKPKFLRDSIWILVPLIILTTFFGFVDELRDYYEVYPIISILIIFSIGEMTGLKLKTNLNNENISITN